jgi:peptidoglycan/xylan/chitin deacetylase (PgdA/CDA1 family)
VTWADEAKAVLEVPHDLLRRRYPPFVTGGALPRGDIPVFTFHGVDAVTFGRQLQYLAENGYRTLSAAEYIDVLTGARPAPERAVLLTFDDGRASTFAVALPLLERLGMKATVFLVPARVRGADAPPPALSGAQEGFVSWAEVEAMVRSGVFDVESHSLTHARIHTGPRVDRFLAPEDRVGYAAMDVPLIHAGGTDLLAPDVPLGTPLLRSAPRLSEAWRFYEDETIRMALPRGPIRGRLETAAEREAAMRRELLEAKRQIEERTGRPVTHLCYPWHAFGPTARRLAAEVGYRTAFCGKVAGVPVTRPGGDLLTIARVGDDYVEMLPGRGRKSLLDVVRHKWRRRFGG